MNKWMMSALIGGSMGLTTGAAMADADYTLRVFPGWYGQSDGGVYIWDNVASPVWATDMYGCFDNESGCVTCLNSETLRVWGNAPSAHAAPGSLGFDVDVHTGCYACCGVGAKSNAYARFALDDVIFSSPDSGSIEVTMNLVLTASHMQGTYVGGSVHVQCPGDPGSPSNGYYCNASGTNIPGYQADTPVAITTATFTVPLNTPWSFDVVLSGHAGVSPKGGARMAHTAAALSFPSSLTPNGPLPVFNVPEGVTVNSVQGGIENNLWTPATPPCPGDLDESGAVDTADLLALLAAWGGSGGDLNNDTTTDVADLLILLAAWGDC